MERETHTERESEANIQRYSQCVTKQRWRGTGRETWRDIELVGNTKGERQRETCTQTELLMHRDRYMKTHRKRKHRHTQRESHMENNRNTQDKDIERDTQRNTVYRNSMTQKERLGWRHMK
jgi:hypothetical protein